MGLKGIFDRSDASDLESERDALRRQRAEAAEELQALKRTLAERVAAVQRREQELAAATERVEKREQKLEGSRGARFEAVRLKLAEAKEARAMLDVRRAELETREAALAAREAALDGHDTPAPAPVTAEASEQHAELETFAAELVARGQSLDARTAELDRKAAALEQREAELNERAVELDARETAVGELEADTDESAMPPADDVELERIEAKLAELHEAEEAFARTRTELAARSDALTEREATLAARERAFGSTFAPPSPDLESLEARIRRLELDGRSRKSAPQTFSAGLRALEERGQGGGRAPDEPLH
jgi:chromosome segregation ATPase